MGCAWETVDQTCLLPDMRQTHDLVVRGGGVPVVSHYQCVCGPLSPVGGA